MGDYSIGVGDGLVTKSCPALAISWTVACEAPLFVRFSRQQYRTGLKKFFSNCTSHSHDLTGQKWELT